MDYLFKGKCTLPSLLTSLALANDLTLRPTVEWPKRGSVRYHQLGMEAQKLTADEGRILVDGDSSEALEIILRYECEYLDKFLDSASGGELREKFFNDENS